MGQRYRSNSQEQQAYQGDGAGESVRVGRVAEGGNEDKMVVRLGCHLTAV